jgi:hypothetical protein
MLERYRRLLVGIQSHILATYLIKIHTPMHLSFHPLICIQSCYKPHTKTMIY